MDKSQASRATAAYTARLERTVRTLQEQLAEQETALEELRASNSSPIESQRSSDPKAHLHQLRLLQSTFEALNTAPPRLPSPDSPLPGLLALRQVSQCITETAACRSATELLYKELQSRLEKERCDLEDARLIQTALEARIQTLRGDIAAQTQKTSSQVAEGLMHHLTKRSERYDVQTRMLVKAFNDFVVEHLAAMLAAEELGGPIAGDMLRIDEEVLGVGFSAKGKAKKASTAKNEDRRQRRIDEIWGPRPSGSEDGETGEPWDESKAAAAEMRELTEQLLNSLVEAEEGNAQSVYVDLPRESAAARFLVRSKVAQFHPRDARKLRLIDFGREIGG